MRTLLLVLCGLLMLNSLEAKKKMRLPASQQTAASKSHVAAAKKYAKSRKAPKHRQKVN